MMVTMISAIDTVITWPAAADRDIIAMPKNKFKLQT